MPSEQETTEDAYKKVLEISKSVFPQAERDQLRTDVLNTAAIEAAFERIQALESIGEVGVARALRLRDKGVAALLVAVGSPAIKYIEYILAITNADGDWNALQEWHTTAIRVLSDMGEPACSLLESVSWSSSKAESVRIEAAYGLLIKRDGVATLSRALNDPDTGVRVAAVGALYRLIMSLYSPGTEPEVPGKYKSLFTILETQCLFDPDDEVRRRTLDLLGIVNAVSLEALGRALDDKDHDVRQTAIWQLSKHKIENGPVAVLVSRAIEDSSRDLSDKAIDILRRRDSVEVELATNTLFDELIVRTSSLPESNFNSERVAQAIQAAIESHPRIHGQTLDRLLKLAFENQNGARRRAILVARRLFPDEFATLVNENAKNSPQTARLILQLLGKSGDAVTLAEEISETEPGDIQKIAAIQIRLLDSYYRDVLAQSNTSFRWAIIVTVFSLSALLLTLLFLLTTKSQGIVVLLTSISTMVSQFIAATQFYLYRQTRDQLAYFSRQLNHTERFLLANSVCESLEGEVRQQPRAELVRLIATFDIGGSEKASDSVSKPKPEQLGHK